MKNGLLIFLLLLAGCDTVVSEPQKVEVPVEVPCKPPVILHPTFPLKTIPVRANVFDKTKAALIEIDLREAYEHDLEAAIKSCGG
jgi:hypothetical protein